MLTNAGILCLEVKGGEVIFEDGFWIHVDLHNNNFIKREGPFKQVLGNMYSLRSHIKRTLPHNHVIQSVAFGCGVLFPDIYFNAHSLEYPREWIFDKRNFQQNIDDYINSLYNHWQKRLYESGQTPLALNNHQVEIVAQLFRQDFHFKTKLPAVLSAIENQQTLLTEEQFELLRYLFDNERVMVDGGAGTGKTLLAMHHASESAQSGLKVLYLTYNKLIAEDIRRRIGTDNLKVVCLHDYLIELTQLKLPIEPKERANYYTNGLPNAFMNLEEHQFTTFDALVIDEGQDLLNEDYLCCFERLLNKGLSGGRWAIFYDVYQNLYNPTLEDGLMLIKSLNPVAFKLNMNCRNTKQIAEYNAKSTSISAARVLKIAGDEVVTFRFNSSLEMLHSIQEAVKKLMKEGVNLSDVVILSSHRKENSKLFETTKTPFASICRFEPMTPETWNLAPDNTLRYMTVHSFKGLEAKIVLLVDFELYSIFNHSESKQEAYGNMLRYTAISRAKAMLYEFVVEK